MIDRSHHAPADAAHTAQDRPYSDAERCAFLRRRPEAVNFAHGARHVHHAVGTPARTTSLSATFVGFDEAVDHALAQYAHVDGEQRAAPVMPNSNHSTITPAQAAVLQAARALTPTIIFSIARDQPAPDVRRAEAHVGYAEAVALCTAVDTLSSSRLSCPIP